MNRLVTILILLASLHANAQYFIKVGNDTTYIKGDSLKIMNPLSDENSVWQVSYDSLNWRNASEFHKMLMHKVIRPAVFRSAVFENNCLKQYSDTIFLLKERNFLSDNRFMPGPNSLEYILQNGLHVSCENGNIPGGTEISVTYADDSIIEKYLNCNCKPWGTEVLNAIEIIGPEASALKVSLPLNDWQSDYLPLLFRYNEQDDIWEPYQSDYLVDLYENRIEIRSIGQGTFILMVQKDSESRSQRKSSSFSGFSGSANCEPALYFIESVDLDFQSATENQARTCYAISSAVKTTAEDCNYSAENYIRQIGTDCQPVLSLITDEQVIRQDDPITFKVRINIGNQPLVGQEIIIINPDDLNIKEGSQETDNNGEAVFTSDSKDLYGQKTVLVAVNYEYYLKEQVTSDGITTEETRKGLKEGFLADSVHFFVYTQCTDPGEIDCTLFDEIECENAKLQLPRKFIIDYQRNYFQYDDIFDHQTGLYKTIYKSWEEMINYKNAIYLFCNEIYTPSVYAVNYQDQKIPFDPEITWEKDTNGISALKEQPYFSFLFDTVSNNALSIAKDGRITAGNFNGAIFIKARMCEQEEQFLVCIDQPHREYTYSEVFKSYLAPVSQEDLGCLPYNYVEAEQLFWHHYPNSYFNAEYSYDVSKQRVSPKLDIIHHKWNGSYALYQDFEFVKNTYYQNIIYRSLTFTRNQFVTNSFHNDFEYINRYGPLAFYFRPENYVNYVMLDMEGVYVNGSAYAQIGTPIFRFGNPIKSDVDSFSNDCFSLSRSLLRLK